MESEAYIDNIGMVGDQEHGGDGGNLSEESHYRGDNGGQSFQGMDAPG